MADKTVKKEKKSRSANGEVLFRLLHNKLAMLGLAVIIIMILIAVFADLIVPYSAATTQVGANKLLKPCQEHIFGCDALGRDLFARVIHGSRVSLLIGFGATGICAVFATIFGSLTAFIGGKFDAILMRFFDVLIAIPTILLSLAICAGFGVGVPQLVIAIAVGQLAPFTRVVRSAVLGITDQEYIEAARAIGLGTGKTILRHVLPNVLGIILVQGTMQVASNILMGAMLSFLGLGAPVPTPEWGTLVSEGLTYIRYVIHPVIFPTIFVALTALSVNLLGDGLRDAFDPKLKGKA